MRFPAEAYDVNRHDIIDLHHMCIAQGYFRLCTDCAQIRVHTDTPRKPSTSVRCSRCTHLRTQPYFLEDSVVCDACVLQQKFLYSACRMCTKILPVNELRAESSDSGRLMCHDCAPQAWPYKCTACKNHKQASDSEHAGKTWKQLSTLAAEAARRAAHATEASPTTGPWLRIRSSVRSATPSRTARSARYATRHSREMNSQSLNGGGQRGQNMPATGF